MAPGEEDLARRGNCRGRERAQGKLRREREKGDDAHGIEKGRRGTTEHGSVLTGLWRFVFSRAGVERKM